MATRTALSSVAWRSGATTVTCEDIVAIAKAAGDAIMGIYAEDPATWEARSKGDDTPVTKADLLANGIILKGLQEKYPAIPIISEESEHLPYSERGSYETYFVVDPLDGTQEFMNRSDYFAVLIALCRGRSPVLGVVYAPCAGYMYFAAKGEGAYRFSVSDAAATEKKLSVRQYRQSEKGLLVAVSRSRPPKDFLATLSEPKPLSIGSAGLKAVAVAAGDVHLFPCVYTVSEWDTAAPEIIVQEAGGRVFQYGSGTHPGIAGAPLQYNKESLGSPSCIFEGMRLSEPFMSLDNICSVS